MISRYKPSGKSASSHIRSRRVLLDVCWIDQSTQWTVANVAHLPVIHLGRTRPLVMSEEADFLNGL